MSAAPTIASLRHRGLAGVYDSVQETQRATTPDNSEALLGATAARPTIVVRRDLSDATLGPRIHASQLGS